MAEQQLANLGQRAAPLTRVTKDSEEFELLAVNATFDGTGASSAFLPCVEVVSDAGIVVARSVATETVAAGGSAEVTFAPFLGRGGGGIEFNKVNVGGYLWVEINDTHFLNGVMFDVLQGAFKVLVDDAATNGEISLGAPYVEIFTNGANLRLLDSGETFFNCDSGASWSFGDFALGTTADSGNGSISLDCQDAASDFTVTAGHDIALNSARLGFFGKTPATQRATPVTLGDVIALLQAYGLAA